MRLSTFLASAAALVATVHADELTTSFMTLSIPGFTMTLPDGIDESFTKTVPGTTMTGTAVIYSNVALITDSAELIMVDLSGQGGAVAGSKYGTDWVNGVTVVDGTFQGVRTTAADTSSTTSAESTADTGSVTKTTSLVTTTAASTGSATGTTITTSTSSLASSSTRTSTTSTATPNSGIACFGSQQAVVAGAAAVMALAIAV